MNIDRLHIDSEEDGFHLLVKDEDGGWHDYRLSGVERSLHDQVIQDIGPWLAERESGRLAFLCSPEDVDESGGAYELSDPKHPRFHSVHADLYDSRAGK